MGVGGGDPKRHGMRRTESRRAACHARVRYSEDGSDSDGSAQSRIERQHKIDKICTSLSSRQQLQLAFPCHAVFPRHACEDCTPVFVDNAVRRVADADELRSAKVRPAVGDSKQVSLQAVSRAVLVTVQLRAALAQSRQRTTSNSSINSTVADHIVQDELRTFGQLEEEATGDDDDDD